MKKFQFFMKFSSCHFKIFSSSVKYFNGKNVKEREPNVYSSSQRLGNKAKNVGSSADQIQNYEKHILMRKRDTKDVNIGSELENLFDNIESTNAQYRVNINNSEQTSPKITELSYNDYLRESDKIFNTLKSAFQEVISQDDKITLETDPSSYNIFLKIHIKNLGTYVIAKELESKVIALTSPLSGLFKYNYDSVSGYWKSAKDSHIMDELLMREFCQHSKGLLIINH